MHLAETKEFNIQIDIEVEYIIIFGRFLTPSEKMPNETLMTACRHKDE